jgi:hypothetical protein
MANVAGKNIDFPGLVAKGENPDGLAVHAPSGTYYPKADEVCGGDGHEYHWKPSADGDRWGHNPMPEHNGDPFSLIPSALPISRKLKK